MTTRLTLIALAVVLSTPLFAQTPWQAIHSRKATVDGQIDSGIKGGSITRAEAVKLRQQFAAIEAKEVEYRKSEGRLTVGEQTDLDKRYQVINKRLTEQQSDRQVR